MAPSTTDEEFVATADQLTDLIATASRNVILRMVRNGLTAEAQRRNQVRHRLRASRKELVPVVRSIKRAMDQRNPAAAEEGVRRLLRTNRNMVLDYIAGPPAGNRATRR